MTINDDKLNQMFEYFRQALKGDADPVNANPPSTPDRASDFIPATHVYEHEKIHQKTSEPQSLLDLVGQNMSHTGKHLGTVSSASFTPVVEPAPVQQNSTPDFVLTPMEADLKEVLRHCLEVENQTLFTVENVLLQQLLRIFLRLEAKMDGLEELISDELIGASKDDQPQPQSQLVFQSHGEEEETEEVHVQIGQNTFVDEGEEVRGHGTYVESGPIPRPEAVITHVPRSSGKPPKAKGNAGKRRRRKRNRKNKR